MRQVFVMLGNVACFDISNAHCWYRQDLFVSELYSRQGRLQWRVKTPQKPTVCQELLSGKGPDGRCITNISLDTEDSNLQMNFRDQRSPPSHLQVGKYIETLLVIHSFIHSFILAFIESLLLAICMLRVLRKWMHKTKYLFAFKELNFWWESGSPIV